ncbi:hypothetical protein ACOME3_003783 [Neoechinorhynchus agilis]
MVNRKSRNSSKRKTKVISQTKSSTGCSPNQQYTPIKTEFNLPQREDKSTSVNWEFLESFPVGSKVEFSFKEQSRDTCGVRMGKVVFDGIEYQATIFPPNARELHFANRIAALHNRKKAFPIDEDGRFLRSGKRMLPSDQLQKGLVDLKKSEEISLKDNIKCVHNNTVNVEPELSLKRFKLAEPGNEVNSSPIERLTCMTSSKINEMFASEAQRSSVANVHPNRQLSQIAQPALVSAQKRSAVRNLKSSKKTKNDFASRNSRR